MYDELCFFSNCLRRFKQNNFVHDYNIDIMVHLKVLFAIHVSLSRTGKLLILDDFLTEQDCIAYKLKGFNWNCVFCKKFH